MNKNVIRAYAMMIDREKVMNFAKGEGIVLTEDEADLFVSTIKENCDDILDGHGLKIINSKKDLLSEEAYDKLIELFYKYKKFID